VLGVEHADVLRDSVRMILGELMEAEVAKLAGAERYEHSPDRLAQRNGYRPREWDTRVGTLELAIPRLRTGRICRVSWSRGAARSRRSSRSCRRRT
jgi:transposase-like protein